METTNNNKVYVYKRFSSKKQDDEQQSNAIELYCNSNPKTTIDLEIVEQESGSVSYIHRELNKLLELLKEGDSLLVSEISRLSRDTFDGVSLLAKFCNIGIILVDCKRYCSYDCSNLSARDKDYIIRDFNRAEEEREFLIYRTKNGLSKAREKGALFGCAAPSYGKSANYKANYDDGRLKGAICKNYRNIHSEKTQMLANVFRTMVPEYAKMQYNDKERIFFLEWANKPVSLSIELRDEIIEFINLHYPKLRERKVKGEIKIINLNRTDIYNFHSNLIQAIKNYILYTQMTE